MGSPHKRELKKKIIPFLKKGCACIKKALRRASSTIALAALKKGSASSKLDYRG
jgi:hypothetical protein